MVNPQGRNIQAEQVRQTAGFLASGEEHRGTEDSGHSLRHQSVARHAGGMAQRRDCAARTGIVQRACDIQSHQDRWRVLRGRRRAAQSAGLGHTQGMRRAVRFQLFAFGPEVQIQKLDS